MPGKEAIISKARYLTGRHAGKCGGHKQESKAHYPGRPEWEVSGRDKRFPDGASLMMTSG
ncbi:MAG: hypothetical protein ACTHMI_16325 [Mucilaginibacter sp.]|jgi:hypothetical protein